ncbi:4-hydroxy-tetrahydrodipicolinate reductase [Sulfobacillus harzensis]|nr:4-hydroxy-tetrahydrodipicolinate reductase [Sulfobacillus harzensis]
MKIPVVVAGVTGKTGSAVGRGIWAAPDMDLIAGLSQQHAGQDLGALWGEPGMTLPLVPHVADVEADYAVLVDFTEPESAFVRLSEAIERGWDIVVGTTGFSAEHRQALAHHVSERGVGAAVIANFSLGAWVAERLAREASRYFEAVEVIEGHHATKKDRPSGTARVMAQILGETLKRPADSIPVHSIRLPGMVAHQAVIFGSQGQMITIRHDVHDRTAYVDGVLAAVRRVHQLGGRLVSDLGEILDPPADPL